MLRSWGFLVWLACVLDECKDVVYSISGGPAASLWWFEPSVLPCTHLHQVTAHWQLHTQK